MDDKMFNKCLLQITLSHREVEAIEFLLKIAKNRLNSTEKELDEKKAIIRAIKKINNGKNKDIDSLCEDTAS